MLRENFVCISKSLLFSFFSFLNLVGTEESESIDASSLIPLDDGMPVDFGAIEVVQCLIEHHNAIFTDANVTIWR